MYLLVVYDVNVERVSAVMKTLRMYLHHVQNSVFEGNITEGNYKELKESLSFVIDEDVDSILVFKFRAAYVFNKEVLGIEKNPADNII